MTDPSGNRKSGSRDGKNDYYTWLRLVNCFQASLIPSSQIDFPVALLYLYNINFFLFIGAVQTQE